MQSLLESIRTVKAPSLPREPELDDFLTSCQSDELPYFDGTDFEGPTPEEEREGAEIMACMCLDHFLPPAATFPEFLTNQARLCAIREDHPWFVWLGKRIGDLASRAGFCRAQTPEQYEERTEVMSRPTGAAYSIEMIRTVASLIDQSCLAAELTRAADTLDRVIRARS